MIVQEDLERAFLLLDRGSGVAWTAKAPRAQALVGGLATSPTHLISMAQKQSGWNFFLCLNPTTRSCTKPAKADITHLSCIGLDLDPSTDRPIHVAQAAELLDASIIRTTGNQNSHIIISSGRGLWAWVFIEPIRIEDEDHRMTADGICKAFTRAVAHNTPELSAVGLLDTTAAEISRIARAPGTINHKTGQHARIVLDYTPIELIGRQRLEEIVRPHMVYTPEHLKVSLETQVPSLRNIAPSLNTTSRQFVLLGVDTHSESRHNRAYSAAKNLHELGVPKDIASLLLQSGAEKCRPNLMLTDPNFIASLVKQIWH